MVIYPSSHYSGTWGKAIPWVAWAAQGDRISIKPNQICGLMTHLMWQYPFCNEKKWVPDRWNNIGYINQWARNQIELYDPIYLTSRKGKPRGQRQKIDECSSEVKEKNKRLDHKEAAPVDHKEAVPGGLSRHSTYPSKFITPHTVS